mmetsp:Transcript_22331/g.28927  ORF Transcript_22331/g.28927 Transcript_22331/m.28927 type:complete len:320 (+) Transcript_22331:88-1047(+)
MAWSREGIMPMNLKQTPTYTLNNLSASESSLAYVAGSEIAMPHLNGEWRSINLQDDCKCFQAKFVSLQNVTLLVLAMDFGIQIWNAGGTRMLFFLPLDGVIECSPDECKFTRGIAGVPDGEYIFVGTFTGDLLIINAQVVEEDRIEFMQAVPGHSCPITALAASEIWLASGDEKGTLVIRDIANGFDIIHTLEGQGFPVTSLAINGDLLAASYSTGHLRFFQITSGSMVVEIAAHSRCINAIDIHPDQQVLVSIGDDTFLNIWTLPDLSRPNGGDGVSLLYSDHVENRLLTGVSFLSDDVKQIAATSYDYDGLSMWGRT